jgi:hypothetical protein
MSRLLVYVLRFFLYALCGVVVLVGAILAVILSLASRKDDER